MQKVEKRQFVFDLIKLEDHLDQMQNDALSPHSVPYYKIIWFTEGKGRHKVDFAHLDIHDNSVLFISENQPQAFDKLDYKGFIIRFNKEFLVQKESDVDFFVRCVLFNSPIQEPLCYLGKNAINKLKNYIVLIKDELNNERSFGKEETLRLFLKAFLIQVQRCKLYNVKNKDLSNIKFIVDEKRNLLIQFVNLIEEHFKDGYNLSQYSSILNISTRTLSNITQTILNKNPSEIIQERVLLEAKRLLLYSNMTTREIGFSLGFSDPSYFVKFFKKHTDKTPLQFKRTSE